MNVALLLALAAAFVAVVGGAYAPPADTALLWLDASYGTELAVDNATLVRWEARAGAFEFAPSGDPMHVVPSPSLNNQPVVVLNGASHLRFNETLRTACTRNGVSAAVVALEVGVPDSRKDALLTRSRNNVQFLRMDTDGQFRFFKGTNPDARGFDELRFTPRVRYVATFCANKPNSKLDFRVNGVDITQYDGGNLGNQEWVFDRLAGGGGCCGYDFQGQLAELLLFNRGLTEEEEAAVGIYLGDKYGIGTSYLRTNAPTPATLVLPTVLPTPTPLSPTPLPPTPLPPTPLSPTPLSPTPPSPSPSPSSASAAGTPTSGAPLGAIAGGAAGACAALLCAGALCALRRRAPAPEAEAEEAEAAGGVYGSVRWASAREEAAPRRSNTYAPAGLAGGGEPDALYAPVSFADGESNYTSAPALSTAALNVYDAADEPLE